MEYLRTRSPGSVLVTRRYPVDLDVLRVKLPEDLERGFDAVVHLGQAPGAGLVRLESIALNVGGRLQNSEGELESLVDSAPLAYRSNMPLTRWIDKLRQAQIPAGVSYHAGTYLCNAVMYLTHHWYASRGLDVPIAFIHLPLASEQVTDQEHTLPSLPLSTLVRTLVVILEDIEQTSLEPSNIS